MWEEVRQEAQYQIRTDRKLQIMGSDRDAKVLELARYHADKANVSQQIQFERRDFQELRSEVEYGCIVTNPPYGERLEDEETVYRLYLDIPR